MAKRKQTSRPAEKLFADDQRDMFEKSYEEQLKEEKNRPVECLGITFENDERRREYFLEKLREKLKDPEFHKIEGFPIGEDDDILALSDPPYYTACPNPFIEDFIKQYGKPYNICGEYQRSPSAIELSATRNNAFVNAHSYATKVPHEIVQQLISHYTEPGDIVLDAYVGSGMTAVAAQFSRRNAIIGDLSPGATFLSANFNLHYSDEAFSKEVAIIASALEKQCGWLYKTNHTDGRRGQITSTLWSDVLSCSECAQEIVFWDCAVDHQAGKMLINFICPHCNAKVSKRTARAVWVHSYDSAIGQVVKKVKQVPVLICYKVGNRRYEKLPDKDDLSLIAKINQLDIPYWFPSEKLPKGYNTAQPIKSHGTTHIHHFFTKRNLLALAYAWSLARSLRAKFMLTSMMYKSSILCAPLMSNYFAAKKGKTRGGWVGKERSGTLYCPSIHSEVSIISQVKTRSRTVRITAASDFLPFITTASASRTGLPDNCVDYIFTDPPFGANKMYSELNFMWECWLRVWTDNRKEAIQNSAQGKGIGEYEELMRDGFVEYYRVLKPGHWITIEFSNTSAAVWNALQNSLGSAGFVIADVRSLDKKQGSILGLTTSVAAKQDLSISAYKPNEGLEDRFKLTAGTEEGVWDFVRTHLKQLPVFVSKNGQAEVIAERQHFLLFDRMVAFHVQRGVTVLLSAAEFYAGLEQRFPARDGMYFLSDQAPEYDKKRITVKEILQLQLFVSDEASAIQWLKQQLTKKPQTFQDIHPQFLKELGGWQKHEKPLELSELLKENFLPYDGKSEVPSQIHSYLSTNFKELRNLAKDNYALRAKGKDRWYVPDPNKAGDLEKLRDRALMREFEEYRESKQKRLKVFRLEAVRAGFKKAWQERDYATIITVARKIPDKILQEDPKLLMWYDQAVTRTGGDQ